MKKSIIKNISLGIACLLGVGGAIAAASILSNNKPFEEARADGAIDYIARYWDEDNKVVVSPTDTCETYTTVTSGTTSWGDGGWYVANNNVTISSRVTISGTVNLILCDGVTLTANRGINTTGATLNIYGQSNDTGSIIATSNTNDVSGIGGGYNGAGGEVIIYGGRVTATGGSFAAGIGGGYNRAGGEVIIYGGTVTASGVKDGAGIGGGLYGTGGNVTVYGGNITATGGQDGAGIGGGYGRAGGEVNIYGGTVTATGGSSAAAGIGGGYNGAHGSLVINEPPLGVFGGNSQDPTDRIYKVNGDYARSRYMVVKDAPAPHIHNDIIFEPWNSSNSLPTTVGDYYLTTDVTLSSGWTAPSGTTSICLNDNSITLGDVITAQGEGCVLNIYDDGTTIHKFTGYLYKENKNYYGKVDPSNYDTFEGNKGEFTGGYIIRSNLDSIGSGEALIKIKNNAEFNLHGGALFGPARTLELNEGNVSVNISGGSILGSGNGIWNSYAHSTISVSGGEFSGNGGHIVKQAGNSTLNLSGGRFTKNTANGIVATTINISGSPYVKDTNNHGGLIVPYNEGVIYLTAPLSQDAHIDIHPNFSTNTRLLTEGWSTYMNGENPADYFSTSVVPNTVVDMEGNEVAVKKTFTITYDGNGATGGDVPTNGTCIYGSSTPVAANKGNLVKTGLFFGGWNTKQDPSADGAVHYAVGDSIAITADTTLYAEWTNHIHDWGYSSSGSTITAECHGTVGVCPFPENKATLTISAPSGDLTYDGSAKVATYGDTSSGAAFSNITITYTKGGTPVGSPIDAGTYVATISFSEDPTKTASVEYTISKANATLTAPTAKTSLVYTGSAQELVNAGLTSDGTIQYRLEDSEYSSDIPTGINAGTYTVYYKVFGDSNHNDSEEQSLVVSISKATIDPVGTLNTTYGKTLGDVILPSGWAWDDPTSTSVGNAGSNEFNATFAEQPNYNEAHQTVTINVATADPDPVGTLDATFGQKLSDVALPTGWAWTDATQSVGNVGSHDFAAHYTAVDTNHHDKDASITVSVSQATPTGYDIPTGLEATYGDTLSSVELPDTWAWKNPNDKVGDAGNREHIAIYTPADPNYKAVEETLTVSVAKANPTYTLPTDIEIYTNETLSNVTLPSGFSWMDDSIKASSLGENTFKVKYTPADQDNYNVVENIDLKVNVKWRVVDPSSSSTSIEINGADEEYTTDISVKVEVKTDISVEQKHNEYASLATNSFVKPNEDIVEIYNVKLIRTTNGVEEEIQPSDIKPGTKIIISMAIPENLVGKEFRLLHIHSEDDVSEVTNYSVSEDGKTLIVEVDRLSEFAFIGATDKDNGFIYNSTPIWALILLIIFSIILLVGIYYLYRLIKDRNDNSNNGDKSVKTMSITFVSPILLAYLGLNGIIIAFIIVAALSVIVWASNLGLLISNKKRKHAKLDEAKEVKKEETKPIEEAKPVETVKDSEPVKPVIAAKEPEPVNEEEEEDTVTITDEKGNVFNIRYIKSFTAKLIQSPIETKKYYEELKNYVLSYKKTTSRVSWHYDSINSGRNQVIKFSIRGKTLCVYYALDANDYLDTKYKVEAVDSKKFEEVPCLYRIKNDRRLGYAKDLIDTVMANLGLVKGEEQHEVYSDLPYEPNAPLIARGLIKEQKVQVNKPIEQVIESHEDEEGNEVVLSQDNAGNVYETRYVKSFRARLIEASDEAKDYYKELRDYILSYQDVDESISWLYDSINHNREQLFKLNIRGKTLCIYYALDTSKVGEKYKVENSDTKKYSKVPCLYRINNPRRVKLAKELIDRVMRKHKLILGEEYHDTYHLKNKSKDELIKEGLIKEVKILVK